MLKILSGAIGYIPSKANATAVAHAVAQDLAGKDMISNENSIKLLGSCQHT